MLVVMVLGLAVSAHLRSIVRLRQGRSTNLSVAGAVASTPGDMATTLRRERQNTLRVPRSRFTERDRECVGKEGEVGGLAMFAPPICTRGDGGTTLFPSSISDEDGGYPANIVREQSEQSNTREAIEHCQNDA